MTKSRTTQTTDWRTVERENADVVLHRCFYVIFLKLSEKAYGCLKTVHKILFWTLIILQSSIV